MGKTRAAVVLFVDIDEEDCSSPQDLAMFVKQGLHQAGYSLHKAPIMVTFRGKIMQVRIVDIMEAGVAAGNGYLWTEATSKAYTQHGIYTEKQQAQIDADEKWEKENGDS